MTAPFLPALSRWLRRLIQDYNAGTAHEFLLYGNVDDVYPIAGEYLPLRSVLLELTARRPTVLTCNLSAGLRCVRGEDAVLAALVAGRGEAARTAGTDAERLLDKLPREPLAMLNVVERVLRHSGPARRQVAVLFDYAGSLVPSRDGRGGSPDERSAAITLHRWGNDPEIRSAAPLLLFVERRLGSVSPDILEGNAGIKTLDLPLPDQSERQAFVDHFAARRTPRGFNPASSQPRGCTPAEVARLAGGLTLLELEDLLLQTWGVGSPLDESDILDRKVDLLHQGYGDIIEVVRPRYGLDAVGGLDRVKAYLAEVAQAMRTGNRKHVPMGVLIMGPPGTGKTFIIECFAKECGLLVVKAKSLRSKWVGESERNQERFFSVLRGLAPVVVIIDESEQEQGARDPDRPDHAVDARLRAQGFQFWGDTSHRGSILRIDLTNWPRLMDPAMLRSGRTDVKVPVLYPDAAAREQILAALCRRHGLAIEGVDLRQLAVRTEGYSPADLEQVVLLADRAAATQPRSLPAGVREEHFSTALTDFMLPRRDRREIDRMTLQALEECSRRSLLPEDADALMAALRETVGGGHGSP